MQVISKPLVLHSANKRCGVDARPPYGLSRLVNRVKKTHNEAEDTTVPNRSIYQVQQFPLAILVASLDKVTLVHSNTGRSTYFPACKFNFSMELNCIKSS